MSYLLAALFWVLPIVFSHVLLLLHIPVVLQGFGAYEWLKLFVFGALLFLAILWRSFFPSTQDFLKHHAWGCGAFGLILGVYWLHGYGISELIGVDPFYSGFLTYLFLIPLVILLSQISLKSMRTIEYGVVVSLLLVSIYAWLQWMGYDPIDYGAPFEMDRVFSTLGNPNSLALYFLLHLPLILLGYRSVWKWGVGILLLVLIAVTGSFSLLLLGVGFMVGVLCYTAGAPKWWYIFFLLFLGITALQWLLLKNGSSKLLSGFTRLELWGEAFRLVMDRPASLLFGLPQAEIIRYLNSQRSTELLRYIPSDYLVLHFHNTWIDVLLQLGVGGVIGVWYCLARWSKKIKILRDSIAISTLALLVIAGMVHHLEITHWSLLVFALFARRRA